MSNATATAPLPPAISRLAGLTPLPRDDIAALQSAATEVRRVAARREILSEGQPIAQPSILLAGWACRAQLLSDGRRQIVSLILPGDLIGMCPQSNPIAATTVLALTEVTLCAAPSPREGQRGTGLAEAYAISAALDQFYTLRNVTRLGRLSAYERTADWLLEMRERLALSGLSNGTQFPMPLTQEMLADALGLTSVHINRTLQTMRRDGAVTLRSGMLTLTDPERLATLVDHRPARVTGT
jgi:CRP-like cAMP-binding protein